ncbi:hypothetical protein A3Q56_06742, partial [Intoshia linei]
MSFICIDSVREGERVCSNVYIDQKPGTSGLRKPTKTFKQEHYSEIFIDASLRVLLQQKNVSTIKMKTLIVGGDGRYHSPHILQKIIKIAATYNYDRLYIGKNGLLSTPAVSNLIIKEGSIGGIVLTASHNPGGPNADFGIKVNMSNGGTATPDLTTKLYDLTKGNSGIYSYSINNNIPTVNLAKEANYRYKIGENKTFEICVIDSVKDYKEKMQEMFDFSLIKNYVSGNNPQIAILVDCMNGVAGPYAKEIFVNDLNVKESSIINGTPLPGITLLFNILFTRPSDFGKLHPDPNLTRAKDLLSKMKEGKHDIGVAFDGDADRNMIIGKNGLFISPCDSLAIIGANLKNLKAFEDVSKITGFARSMPTSSAIDRVANKLNIPCYEVPTGWKFFGNLMNANKICLCGEESFGTGSNYIREKDGVWTILVWLSILAKTKQSVEEILQSHWQIFGRNYYARLDFENVESEKALNLMNHVEMKFTSIINKTYTITGKKITVKTTDNFEYHDTVDQSISKNQGLRILFGDGSRIIFRVSGTGSTGATVRLYIGFFISIQIDSIVHYSKDVLKRHNTSSTAKLVIHSKISTKKAKN